MSSLGRSLRSWSLVGVAVVLMMSWLAESFVWVKCEMKKVKFYFSFLVNFWSTLQGAGTL